MDIKDLRSKAREMLKGYCRVCPVCNGRACSGEVPGMGGIGTGAAFRANLEALAACRLNMRTLHDVKEADTSITFFGKTFASPVQVAPMTGTTYNLGGRMSEKEFAEEIVAGARDAGGWDGPAMVRTPRCMAAGSKP